MKYLLTTLTTIMSVGVLTVVCALSIGFATSPSYASDTISCSSFEGCVEGSSDVTNILLQMQAEIAALMSKTDSLEADNAALEGLVTTLQSELAANTAADSSAHHTKYTNAESIAAVGPHFSGDHADLTNVVATQHHAKYTDADAIAAVPDYSALLAGASRGVDPNTSQDTLTFTNMNVQVVSGSGTTDGGVTGTGNLIIGYNEPRDEALASVPCPSDVVTELFCNRRTGSHMLIIGTQNNYSRFGGMVVGGLNETAANYASISGGTFNTASGDYASVSGGFTNTASGLWASVSGGRKNTASVSYASVSGGDTNTASGEASSVSGGMTNTASGPWASVSGGQANTANATSASVSGGLGNTASALYATAPQYTDADAIAAVGSHSPDYSALLAGVTRGPDQYTTEDTLTFTNMNVQVVSGSGTTDGGVTGTGNLIIGYNEPRDEALASFPCPSNVVTERWCNRRTGSHMLIIGEQNNYSSFGGMVAGFFNETAADFASVSGGQTNRAYGDYASVSGGANNIASGQWASVSGGALNTASGDYASVSGGQFNTASGLVASVSGGAFKTAATSSCTVGDNGVDC